MNAFSNATSYHSNEFNSSQVDLPPTRVAGGNITTNTTTITESPPVVGNGCGITQQSFAFNRVNTKMLYYSIELLTSYDLFYRTLI